MKISVMDCNSNRSIRSVVLQKSGTPIKSYDGYQKCEKMSVVSSSDAIVDPLAMVVAIIDTIVALGTSLSTAFR